MDKIPEDHLYLLLDEPIYVLADHGDHPIDHAPESVDAEQENFTGSNNLGISVFIGDADKEDIEFLFKGLYALKIESDDIALFNSDYDPEKEYPDHTKRLIFSEQVNLNEAFKVNTIDKILVMTCIPLQEIRNNQDYKIKFWVALKSVFK